jgi:hypothetical protein
VILRSPVIEPYAFEQATGWAIKPEGACRGEFCVPLRNRSLQHVAERLAMPVVHDYVEGLWALGPAVERRPAAGIEAPELELPDLDGTKHRLSDFRGLKVLVVAWAPW